MGQECISLITSKPLLVVLLASVFQLILHVQVKLIFKSYLAKSFQFLSIGLSQMYCCILRLVGRLDTILETK